MLYCIVVIVPLLGASTKLLHVELGYTEMGNRSQVDYTILLFNQATKVNSTWQLHNHLYLLFADSTYRELMSTNHD